jgi:hypothetical protein
MARSLGKHGSLLAAAALISTSVGGGSALGAVEGTGASVFSALKAAAGGRGATGPDAVAAGMHHLSLGGAPTPAPGSDPALFAKVSDLPAVAGPAEGGLASMIKRSSSSSSSSGGGPAPATGGIGAALTGGAPAGSGLSGSLGALGPSYLGGHAAGGPVVLAASFRDPMYLPVGGTINEEDGASEEDSDVELGGSGVKRSGGLRPRPAPAGGLVDSDDEHPGPLASSTAGGVAVGGGIAAAAGGVRGSAGVAAGSSGSAASSSGTGGGKPPPHPADDGGFFGDF